ncbi:MAG TPA: recombinase RecA [Candidatus Dojkabacteria bacterium]|nr:recombinase RecA [Candidatus Dojkabacteria bacterium]
MATTKKKKTISTPTKSENVESPKKKAIEIAVSQIEKQFGKGSIMKLGDDKKIDVEVIPTGALSLDVALGVGGIPKGRIIEIYGPESSGKTTLALHIMAEAQKMGEAVALIDAEHAFDPTYAKNIGLKLDDLYISQPDFGEQALEILETLVRSAAFGVVVVDSVAALTPRAEIEGEMGDSHMGLQARLMSQALRKITAITSKTGTTIIFINQLRMKIGVMFGNPETTTGGNALKFYASIRLDIRQKDKILKDGKIIGHTRKVKVAKNKMAPPFKEATFDMIYPMGIDKESSIIDAALDLGIVEKKGSWYNHGDMQLGQGKEATSEMLKEDKKLRDKIVKEVKATIK